MMDKLLTILEQISNFSENKKINRFVIFWISPILFILEYLCYWYFWKKTIIPELLTNDEIVSFLSKNDFIYTGKTIIKVDLLDSNEFYKNLSLDEAKESLKREFVFAFDEIFKKHLLFNVGDYINLRVFTEIKKISKAGEIYKARVFRVKINFYRLFYLDLYKKNSYFWFILMILSIIIGIKFHLITLL